MNFKKLRQVLSLLLALVLSLTSGVAKVAGTSEESNGPASGMIEALAAENAASQVELTGVVLAPGFDDKNPVIEHRQGTTFTYTGIGIPLEAVVSDNISVARVAALVQQAGSGSWNEVSLHLHEGSYRSGIYRGQIPREMVKEPYLDYKIVAEDNSGNRTETIPCRVEVSFGLQPDWIEDFSEEPFFWVWDGDWEWGEPGGSGSPAPQYGGKLMATNLDGNYSDNSYSYLMLPPLDLREESLPGLRLDHWYDIEPDRDVAVIAISADYGESWDEYYFTGRDRQWRTSIINLAPYAGSPNPVTILFELYSDSTVNYAGWYIDRVAVGELTGSDLYLSDFESDAGRFTVSTKEGYSNCWEWGSPSGSGPGAAHSGQKLWATNLNGSYLGHHNAVIWSPPLDLRNLNYCYVEFYHWYEIGENDYGRFVIYTPADQKSWYFEQDYEGTKPFWSRDTYNLQWFIDKGYPEIQVGFHFVSQDQPPDLSGWYIDDVRVYDTVDLNLPAAPGQVEPVPVPATVAEMLPLPQLQPLKRNDQEFLEQAGKPLPEGIISREIPLRQTAPEPQPLSQTLSQTLSITGEPLLYWIPVEATLTALGTDCSTTTNPEDGTFHLSLPSGEPITLQVEAAGYERETRAIDPTEIERFQVFLLGFDLEMGDLNQVAGVDVGDAILLLRYIVDLHSLDQDQRLAADVNLDNHLNVGDAILMLRHIVGLTPSLPVYN